MLNRFPVTVIGAGIGGLAVAIALAERGAVVRVLEQADELRELGAGLQITPNGVAVLDALGLGEGARERGLVASAVELRDYRVGRKVVRLDMMREAGERPYLLMHRADLVKLLEARARALGVLIAPGRRVIAVAPDARGGTLTLADGSREEAAFVVGADGLHSRVRPALNGEQAPFFTGQVAWRALVPCTDRTRREVRVHMGPGRHVVTYPLRGAQVLNVVAVEERDQWMDEGWNHPGEPEEMRRAFSMFCAEITTVLKHVETVHVWGLFRHPVAERWFGAGCALLGDAAHPTLPFLAQGANMALEDAWVLADCLSAQPLEDALPAYQKRRRARVARVIEAANANARNYHLRNPLVRFAAHSGLRAAGAIAPEQIMGRFDWVHAFDVTAR